MAGLNTTGLAAPGDYNLGRGKLYLASLSSGVPDDGGWRDLGNCTEFNVSVEVETLEHQSSREGLKVVDKEVTLSQKMNLSFTLDEINYQNLALFFSGEAEAAAITNPAVAGVTSTTLVTSALDYSAVGGRWYDLKTAAGVRCYDIATANLSLNSDTAGLNNVLVENTDYTVDEKMGRVFILSGTTLVDPGDDIKFVLAADAGAVAPSEVRGLTQTNIIAALKFISENPANNDQQSEVQFHQVQLKPEGDFALIGDEWTQMSFTAVAEANTTLGGAGSPYVTVRTHANA